MNASQITAEMVEQIVNEAAKQDLQELKTAQLLYDNTIEPQFPPSMTTESKAYRQLAWTPVAMTAVIVDKIATMLYGRTVNRTTGVEAWDDLLKSVWKTLPRLMVRNTKVASIAGYGVIRLRPVYPGGIAYADMGIGNASPILDPDDPHGKPIGMAYDYLEEPIKSQLSRAMGGASDIIHVREVITRHLRDKDGKIIYPGIHGRLENGKLVDTGDDGLNLLGDYLDCILWIGTDHPTSGTGKSDVLPIMESLIAVNETMTDEHEAIIWNIWPMLTCDDENADIRYTPRTIVKLGENAKGDPAKIERIGWSGSETAAWDTFYEKLLGMIHQTSRIPAISVGDLTNIGAMSSGVAFEVSMTPALDLTREKEVNAKEQEIDLMETSIAMLAYYGKVAGFTDKNPFSTVPQPDALKIHEAMADASVEFAPVKLPKDKTAEATIRSILRGAGLESTKTGIRILHPDWSDDQVDDELKAVGADTPEAVNASAELRIKQAQEKLKNDQE